MAEPTSFRGMVIMFALVGLFMFALFGFGFELQTANNANTTIMDNQYLNSTFGNLSNRISDMSQNATSQRENFESDVPEAGTEGVVLFTLVGVKTIITATVIGMFNLITRPLILVFGLDPIVVNTLITILMVSIIILGWRVLKSGE